MKPIIPFALFGALFAIGAASAATTDPVGYITIPLPGAAVAGAQRLQLSSQGLLPGDALQVAGVAESFGSDGGGTFLQDDQGTWAAGAYVNGVRVSHVVEITSGPLQGSLTWVTSTAANKIYTQDNLSGAGAGASFRVLKAFTISSLLGDPPAVTVLGGGATQGAADNLQILDPVTNTYQTFWYKNSGVGGTGWRSTGIANENVASTAIFPSDGLVIIRKQTDPGSLVIAGAVKTGQTKVVVEGNVATTVLNIIATQVPVDQITFAASGLYTANPATGVKGGATQNAADNILIFDATTNTYTTFWYKDSGVGGTGWRATGVADPANYVIPANNAILIQRKNGASFTWTVPGVNVGS